MTVTEAIRRAVPVFAAHPTADVYFIRDRLVSDGIPVPLAADIVEFLPLAVARAVLDGMGIRFADEYVRQTPRGQTVGLKKLMDEPVYREGLTVAGEISEMGDEVFLALIERSPEYQAIRKALDTGARPEDLECAAPTMIATDGDVRPSSRLPGRTDKAWWQFWR
ncbi:MAG: hypothetical protein JWO38_2060 [Gemmataceae bacterium]|nr:hypothetical protein [Gemmataceae bacterium]